jgi:hypothetical protein
VSDVVPPSENASARVRLPADPNSQGTAAPQRAQFAPPLPQAPATQPGYPLQFGLAESYQTAPFNRLAIAAFITAFFAPLVGIILGHIALTQFRGTSQRGYSMALAGTLIGYTLFLLGGIVLILFVMALAAGSLRG